MNNHYHTPGPWYVTLDPYQVGRRDDMNILTIIARCDNKPFCAPPSECSANARLIAAAPEMLIALELARKLLDTVEQFVVDPAGTLADVALAVRGAIQKAVGVYE